MKESDGERKDDIVSEFSGDGTNIDVSKIQQMSSHVKEDENHPDVSSTEPMDTTIQKINKENKRHTDAMDEAKAQQYQDKLVVLKTLMDKLNEPQRGVQATSEAESVYFKTCIAAINGRAGEREGDSEALIFDRIRTNLSSFSQITPTEKIQIHDLLLDKLSTILAKQANGDMAQTLLEGLTQLSASDQRILQKGLEQKTFGSETKKWAFLNAKEHKDMIDLALISPSDRPEIIKNVFYTLQKQTEKQGYSAFGQLAYLLRKEDSNYFKKDIQAYLENYISTTFSLVEERIQQKDIPNGLLLIRHTYLKSVFDGLDKEDDSTKEIQPILALIDAGLLKIEALSKKLDSEGQFA